MNLDLDTLAKIGGFAGWASFIWLVVKDIVKFVKKPFLKIERLISEKSPYKDTQWERTAIIAVIRNKNKQTALHCVGSLKILSTPDNISLVKNEFFLYWTDMENSDENIKTQHIDIGMVPQKLDIIFTQNNIQIPGCLVSTRTTSKGFEEAQRKQLLPPGIYEVELMVQCENGKGQAKRYKIFSPKVGENPLIERISRWRRFLWQ